MVTSNTNCRCIKFRGSSANGANFNGLICPLFDGRRGQIYTGLYTYEGEQLTSIEEDRIILIVDWLQMLKDKGQPVLFIGNDVKLHKETIIEHLGDQAVFAPFTKNNPRPSELAFLGLKKKNKMCIRLFQAIFV